MKKETSIGPPGMEREIKVGKRILKFVPHTPSSREEIANYQTSIGIQLPPDFIEFISLYGPANYFGTQIEPLSSIEAVYRYEEDHLAQGNTFAMGLILFAHVAFFESPAEFRFALIFPTDLRKKPLQPNQFKVQAFIGEKSHGEIVEALTWESFSSWKENWPDRIEKNADRWDEIMKQLKSQFP